ncbi:MAG: hypothetical protein IT201_14250 [Thermoleophilia bacterium]|nr:hypothetical protein [Thermoleophilia bacterium]
MKAAFRRLSPPSPAMVVALVALFLSLGGVAVATTAIVPLAKRALTADNAKKLEKQTLAQVVATPGPASSATGLVRVTSRNVTLAAGAEGYFDTSCDSGQRAVSGGLEWVSGNGSWWWSDSIPSADGTGWRTWLDSDSSSPIVFRLYAVCLA